MSNPGSGSVSASRLVATEARGNQIGVKLQKSNLEVLTSQEGDPTCGPYGALGRS